MIFLWGLGKLEESGRLSLERRGLCPMRIRQEKRSRKKNACPHHLALGIMSQFLEKTSFEIRFVY